MMSPQRRGKKVIVLGHAPCLEQFVTTAAAGHSVGFIDPDEVADLPQAIDDMLSDMSSDRVGRSITQQ